MGGQGALGIGLALVVLVALVMTGIGSLGGSPEPLMGGGSGVSDQPTTTTQVTSPTPTTDASATTPSAAAATPGSANLSKKEQTVVIRVVSNFTEKLPENETERRAATLATAEELCEYDQINTAQLKRGGTQAKAAARRMEYGAQIINEHFTNEVPTRKLTKIRGGVKTATKYTPVIGSYNRMTVASCRAAEYRNETAIKRFYWAAMMFGVDVALIQANAFYAPAFRSTGFATNQARKLGLWRLRRLCGNRCLALGMSELHVAMRAGLYGAIDKTLYDLGEIGIKNDEVDWRWVAEQQGWNQSRLPRNFPNRSKIVGSAESVDECSVVDDAVNVSKDIAGQAQDAAGIDTSNALNETGPSTVDCEG